MQLKDSILGRRSIRRYKDREVPLSLVGEIIELAKHAPSSGNLQNWRFIIVTDMKKREKLAEASLEQYWMVEAPVHIVVCNDYEKVKEHYGKMGRMYSIQNCAAVAYAIMLAAQEKGLGTCWVGAFDPDAVQRELNIPQEMDPEIIITLGYSNDKKMPALRETLHYLSYFEEWGTKVKGFSNVDDVKKKLSSIKKRFK
tara:strand:+ start:1431 stop:2024 length:594 start_codon:yes stop_codon:yes gene_type:complete